MKKLTLVSIGMVSAMLMLAGCFTRAIAYTKTNPDGTKESCVSILGTGDKVSQVAAEGLFADGSAEDLGAGVKNAAASQQSTGIEGTLAGMGQLMTGMAQFMSAAQGIPKIPAVVKPPVVVEAPEDSSGEPPAVSAVLPPENAVANAETLKAKIAEAKATGKPLVVLAGNTGCGYCDRMEAAIKATPAFTARTDIVFYQEKSPWGGNQAAKWTGGGLFPVLRVTQWDADGKILCDKKVERPLAMSDIYAAMNVCSAPK